ncbi:MAG: hypothetical protein JSW07_04585 [bacterium]|nr:MAG: hypothetical protein JSW07_04585 [bacterium]
MSNENLISFILVVALLALFFTFCAIVIKRYWIDKKSVTSGSQFVGEEILKQWQNRDKKRAMEHVIYQKEDEEEEDEEGEAGN